MAKMRRSIFHLARVLLLLALLFPGRVGAAQQPQPTGAVYIVQEGDSLWDIAIRFGVSLVNLEAANNITDPGQISTGSQLVIPGLEGVQGVLTTRQVVFGESLRSLSRQYHLSQAALRRLNHLTSPAELYAGASLILPVEEEISGTVKTAAGRAALAAGQTLLELSILRNTDPWTIAAANALTGTATTVPGDVLHLPASAASEGPGALPDAIGSIEVKPLPVLQGGAAVITITGQPGMSFSGSLVDHELHFFSEKEGTYIALQGVHALTEPGLYLLAIAASLPGGVEFRFSQTVYVRGGDYPFDPVLTVSPETIDPAVTGPEDAQWKALAASFSPVKLWDGIFQSPAPPPFSDCWPSRFGNRRSYNGSAYLYFHSGLDFCGGVGGKILAPAAGTVIFAGPLTVRGNATMIDHGWGVFTGYMHQSEILVKVGDHVDAGQEIGKVGGTGRVTGPHLHWEVFAGGVQVDPMTWLEQAYP